MQRIAVAARNDGTIDVDLCEEYEDEDDETWNFNNLTIEEGEFLLEELTHAISRAKARKAKLDARQSPALNP
jgi:hypothetical protein